MSNEEANTFGKMIDKIPKESDKENKAIEDKRFIRMASSFVDIDDIHIDLIDQVNPFQRAFEVLSKSLTKGVLKIIQETIEATRIKMDFEVAKNSAIHKNVQSSAYYKHKRPARKAYG